MSTGRNGLTVTDPFVEAIHRGCLYDVAEGSLSTLRRLQTPEPALARHWSCAKRSAEPAKPNVARVVTLLRVNGCELDTAAEIGPRQNHTIELRVADYDTA